MDIAAAEAPGAPWLVVGILVTVAALLLAGLVAALVVRRRAARPPSDTAGADHDDLPGFLEFPPGSAPAAHSGGDFVALAAPPPAPAPSRQTSVPVLAAVAVMAVLLLVVAAVVASTTGGAADRAERSPAAQQPEGVEARMRFAGVVLEQQAVGVTVTYAEVELASDGDGPVARLTLPTWNCLAAEAPDDPEAAGCVPGRTEYAEVRSPALEVTRTADDLRFTGDFATSIRPTGSAPEETGRTYRIDVVAEAEEELRPGRTTTATGVLALEGREAVSVEGEIRVAG